MQERLFFLSPARLDGARAHIIMRDQAAFDVAIRLRQGKATLGEVFSFMSGLYFRGKLFYAKAFVPPALRASRIFIITSGAGLVAADTRVTREEVKKLAGVGIDDENHLYALPLKRDAQELAKTIGPDCLVILLGSVATSKYSGPLTEVFGERLLFPAEFVGRGDLSRGGLLLRAALSGKELRYKPVGRSTQHGSRPPKLSKKRPAIRA